MSRAFLVRASAALLTLLGAWAAYTHAPVAPRPATSLHVNANLHMISGEG